MCDINAEINVIQTIEGLKDTLEEFDYYWVSFEQVILLCIIIKFRCTFMS